MAMSSAEKQHAYRERHLGVDGSKVRVELILDAHAAAQLRRLAGHRGLPVTAVVEQLAGRTERRALAGMAPAEERRYLRADEGADRV
jgi:hypothetical protein